ncbi:MAG: Gfo/Idh/MocA family oxidoreductase [Ectothiorhodospiraceae bacterium]|nr:Gfo/Idh/MocA family oxidoreductase [Ectothiorhodospiraceae bacterium]
MSNTPIRIGLIGAGGNMRARHMPGFQAMSGVEVVTVANRTPASSRAFAEEFGIPDVAPDWRAVLDDDRVDAVCIGTWPYMHAPITIAALEAGKHVLCEARMALDSSEAHRMLDVARAHPGQVAQIVPAPMTFPFDRTVMEMIGAGHIGELIGVDARIAAGSDFPDWDSPPHWRHDRVFSGNNIMSMGIWYECLMRWVGRARSVQAVGNATVNHRRDGQGNRVAMTIPDHIDIIGELEQGGQLRLCVTTVAGLAPSPVDILVFGTEGTLRLHQPPGGEPELFAGRRGDKSLQPVKIDAGKRGDWQVEEDFIASIRNGEPVTLTDFATGVHYMEWTDAVTLSLRGAGRVSLPLVQRGR